MYKLLHILGHIVAGPWLLGVICVCAFADENLLENGDFAAGLDGWSIKGGNANVEARVDAVEKYQDRSSLRLAAEAAGKPAQLILDKPINIRGQTFYMFSAFVKGRGITEKSGTVAWIDLDSTQNPKQKKTIELHSGHWWGEFPLGNFDWTPIRYYFPVPAGMDTARLRLAAIPGAVLFYNDVRMTSLNRVDEIQISLRDAVPVSKQERPTACLTDSICRPADGKEPYFSYKGLENGITASLELPRLMNVDRIVVFLLRPNPSSHKLRTIEVMVRKYGQWIKFGTFPGYWTEDFNQRLWQFEIPVEQITDSLKFKFTGEGYLCISEFLVIEKTLSDENAITKKDEKQ